MSLTTIGRLMAAPMQAVGLETPDPRSPAPKKPQADRGCEVETHDAEEVGSGSIAPNPAERNRQLSGIANWATAWRFGGRLAGWREREPAPATSSRSAMRRSSPEPLVFTLSVTAECSIFDKVKSFYA